MKIKDIFSKIKNKGYDYTFEDDEKNQKKGKFKTISITAFVIFLLFSYYFTLVPINIRSMAFCSYLIFVMGVFAFIFFIDSFKNQKSKKVFKFVINIIALLILAIFISNIYSSPIFHAKRYASLITKKESKFEEDIKTADFSTIPVVDRDTAIRLGARKMGEMGDKLVSQYNIDDTYSQICIKGKPVRVTPLVYADDIKWFLNRKNGIPYYIKIDMVTQNSSLVKLDKPIMYSMSDKFQRNLYRHIRFSYPTAMISEINFETDDDGNPYFVATCKKPTIGLFGAPDISYIIVVDANTGKMQKYSSKEAPEWVDRVYPANMIEKQLIDNGRFSKGFINSKIKQEGVTKPTEGYNYITIGNDIYMYTGITSVLSDESNIGFVFVNMRTKQTKFYPVSSAEEFSVMDSAAGAVQEKGYKATFPILINLNNRPTYFMSLKDAAMLTKMFALVDAQSYQKVAVGNTLEQTVENYKKVTSDLSIDDNKTVEKHIEIEDIKNVVVEGNTMYYIKAKGEDKIFTVSIELSPDLAFIKPGDKLDILGSEAVDTFIITNIKN